MLNPVDAPSYDACMAAHVAFETSRTDNGDDSPVTAAALVTFRGLATKVTQECGSDILDCC